jgi:hypothetical protein
VSPDLKRTLVVDAAIVALLVALALILAPGLAIVGAVALLVLFAGVISFIFSEVRARRRLGGARRGSSLKAPARRDSRSRVRGPSRR